MDLLQWMYINIKQSITVTVTEAFILRPLVEDRGCIIEQISLFPGAHIQTNAVVSRAIYCVQRADIFVQ